MDFVHRRVFFLVVAAVFFVLAGVASEQGKEIVWNAFTLVAAGLTSVVFALL